MSDEVKNPPAGMPGITTGVYYQDSTATIDWLENTFGFKTRL
ncbi:MAG: hypothetical protein VYD70_09815 [Planctomycetota bacterium]|nr:hypothetical protein [Planctomycetota bacterium]